MDRPDLAALAAETNEIITRIDGLRDKLDAAMEAALGESDPETEVETVPSNGDEFAFYENAKGKAADARFAIGSIVDILATQQGYREFEATGVDVS